jgi:hypothetical protein
LKPSIWGNGQKIPGRLARFSQIDYEIGPSARNLFPLPKWPKHQPPLSHGHLGDCCQTHKDQYGNRPGWVKGCFLRGRILKKTNALLNISKSEQDSHVEMHAIPYGLSLKSRFECPIYWCLSYLASPSHCFVSLLAGDSGDPKLLEPVRSRPSGLPGAWFLPSPPVSGTSQHGI